MPGPTLRGLLNPRSGSLAVVQALCGAAGGGLSVADASGKTLLGDNPAEGSAAGSPIPITLDDSTLGFVSGPAAPAAALASLLSHLAARESEQRALASETLHLYREIHLIEQLSEQLAALLNMSAVSESALAQARRLIPATQGSVLVLEGVNGSLRPSPNLQAM